MCSFWAAAGIGRETALAFCREGAIVHAIDRDARLLRELSDESPGMVPHVLDLTDSDAIDRFHAGLERLDVQVNCAGIVPVGTLLDCNRMQWEGAFEINVTAIFSMMQAGVARMLKGGGARSSMWPR